MRFAREGWPFIAARAGVAVLLARRSASGCRLRALDAAGALGRDFFRDPARPGRGATSS